MFFIPTLTPLRSSWAGQDPLVWPDLYRRTGFRLVAGALARTQPHSPLQRDQVDDLIFYAVGIVLGGRLGYAFFYGFDRLSSDPLWLLRVWEGGMAFHGGLIGVLVAMAVSPPTGYRLGAADGFCCTPDTRRPGARQAGQLYRAGALGPFDRCPGR